MRKPYSYILQVKKAGKTAAQKRLDNQVKANSVRIHEQRRIDLKNAVRSSADENQLPCSDDISVEQQTTPRVKSSRKSVESAAVCSPTCPSLANHRIFLPHLNKCVVCNEDVSLYTNNREKAQSSYQNPDSYMHGRLRRRLLNIADHRLKIDPSDSWALEVKGRLEGMRDLHAEGALIHTI